MRNTLIAIHPTLEHPRLLLTDFEFSRYIKKDEDRFVNLWWLAYFLVPPPEGIREIDGFAFDLYRLGVSFKSIVTNVSKLWLLEIVALMIIFTSLEQANASSVPRDYLASHTSTTGRCPHWARPRFASKR